jgi:tetratricopeptide (TPR) repeat protein
MARTLLLLGRTTWNLGDQDKRARYYEESLALYRALGDRRGIAQALASLSVAASNMGRVEEAERLGREAVAIAQELGDAGLHRGAVLGLSTALHDAGRFAEATAAREEVLAISRDQGILMEERESFSGVAGARLLVATSARHEGDYGKARAMIQAALPVLRESRHRMGTVYCRLELGRQALAGGAYDEAEDQVQRALALLEGTSGRFLRQEGHAALAYASLGKGERAQAGTYLTLALRLVLEGRHLNAALQCLPAMALLLMGQGGPSGLERAVELYALAARVPYVANSRWFEDVAGREIRAAAEALPAEVATRAQERGRARDLWATMEELLAELEAATPA